MNRRASGLLLHMLVLQLVCALLLLDGLVPVSLSPGDMLEARAPGVSPKDNISAFFTSSVESSALAKQ